MRHFSIALATLVVGFAIPGHCPRRAAGNDVHADLPAETEAPR